MRFYSTAPADEVVLQLRNAMKEAMKARDAFKTSTLKSVLGDIQNASKLPSAGSALSTLKKAVKRRQDALATLPPELQQQYKAEIGVLEPFVGQHEPAVDLAVLEEAARAVAQELGGAVKMGDLMRAVKARLPDAPGKELALAVKKVVGTLSAPA